MALPSNFSEFEHLQSVVRRIHNRAVQQFFKNQSNLDISTPKASLKHACLIKDDDTQALMLQRQWLFEVTAGHAQSFSPETYSIPVEDYQRNITFRPQIKLYFKQPRIEIDAPEVGLRQVKGEITFRLVDKTSATITRTDAERLARDIKREFGTPLQRWEKGKYKVTYKDVDRGYDLRLLVRSQNAGEQLVRKILAIQNHSYEPEYFQFVDNNLTVTTNPGTHRVYGKTVKKHIRRPQVSVQFLSAQLLIWGRQRPINLVSHGARLREVIEFI